MKFEIVESRFPVIAHCKLGKELWTMTTECGLWADNIKHVLNQGAKPATLDDSVYFRYHSKGADHSDDYQKTGSLVGIVRTGPATWKIYPYDPQTPEEFKELVGIKDIARNPYFDMSTTDELAKKIMGFEGGRRVIETTKNIISLLVAPDKKGNYKASAYAQREPKNLMPKYAHLNAKIIHECFKCKDAVYGNLHFDLPDATINEVLRLRPVGLGGVDYCVGIVNASGNVSFGRLRGR